MNKPKSIKKVDTEFSTIHEESGIQYDFFVVAELWYFGDCEIKDTEVRVSESSYNATNSHGEEIKSGACDYEEHITEDELKKFIDLNGENVGV